jgi:DNA-binding LytR/AlgR family response regulator
LKAPVFSSFKLMINKKLFMEEHTGGKEKAKTRLVVRKGDENIALNLEDVALIYRDGPLIIVVDMEQAKYVSARNLSQLENELRADTFFRVNRKYIININAVRSFRSYKKTKLEVSLLFDNTDHHIIVGKETVPLFKKWISQEP